MATMPGAVVIPAKYGESMVLYSAVNRVECVVDGAPAGKNGRLFIVEPGKPVKVPYEAGRFILEHMAYLGVVRVMEEESDTGITYHIEEAKEESLDSTKAQDEKRFHQWVNDMVDDYIRRNKPVPPPAAPILAIIERRKLDPKKFGIVPIGWADPEKESRLALEAANRNMAAQLAELQKTVAELQDQATKPTKKG